MSDWVSVTTRLPHKNGMYLVYDGGYGLARFDSLTKRFIRRNVVTHWMELVPPSTIDTDGIDYEHIRLTNDKLEG